MCLSDLLLERKRCDSEPSLIPEVMQLNKAYSECIYYFPNIAHYKVLCGKSVTWSSCLMGLLEVSHYHFQLVRSLSKVAQCFFKSAYNLSRGHCRWLLTPEPETVWHTPSIKKMIIAFLRTLKQNLTLACIISISITTVMSVALSFSF